MSESSSASRSAIGAHDSTTVPEQTREAWEQTANRALEQAGRAERIDGRSLADASDAAYQAGDLARAAELSREPHVHLDPLAVKKQIRALDAGEPCDDPTVQRSYAVRDRNRELERERAEPDQQQAGEQERISWVERELDRIAAAIREVREYIERAREWAREQAQARRVAGVDRDEGRGR